MARYNISLTLSIKLVNAKFNQISGKLDMRLCWSTSYHKLKMNKKGKNKEK